MCPKPISAKTGRSIRASSSPRQINDGVKRNTPVGLCNSLFSVERTYHTVLLFKTPTSAPQVCCAPVEGVAPDLQMPRGCTRSSCARPLTELRYAIMNGIGNNRLLFVLAVQRCYLLPGLRAK